MNVNVLRRILVPRLIADLCKWPGKTVNAAVEVPGVDYRVAFKRPG